MKTFDKYAYLESVESPSVRASYRRTLEKHNAWSTIANVDVRVFCFTERYYKNGRKNFPKKPSETERFDWGPREYLNCITAIPFFKDRVEMGYTQYGFIPVKLTHYSFDGNLKWVRRFAFEDRED